MGVLSVALFEEGARDGVSTGVVEVASGCSAVAENLTGVCT